jgi:hypothetical protein
LGAQQSPQAISKAPLKWTATWISHPSAPLREPLTLHFRRTFSVDPATRHYVIHVSADNRFILYLNGERIGEGPARGDLDHWRYETFDLGPRLKSGPNTLAATVWNFGIYAPTAQITDRLAFLVQGHTEAESEVNTDSRWMVEVENGQVAYPRKPNGFWKYMAVGPGETMNAADFDWNWLRASTDDPAPTGHWVAAASAMRETIFPSAGIAAARGTAIDNPWRLVPDDLPPMTYQDIRVGKVVRSDLPSTGSFPVDAVSVAANSHVHILLDREILTTAYPRLEFSDGKNSRVELTYAEALYDDKQLKGDRDEIDQRKALGEKDLVLPDGGKDRVFEPLWWRTWRYLDLDITTSTQPLRLNRLRAHYTAYPFEQKAHFTSSDEELNRIWQIGWHTLELDAHETFMDTPYYEQLQYVGDSRVEAMIAYTVSGDDRLPREAIRAIDGSRRADGLTASRSPSSLAQYIPPFSLLWVGMLYDFAVYRNDPPFISQELPGTRSVLRWFANFQAKDGLLQHLPEWSFVDWTADGVVLPSYDAKGKSCLLTLEYIGALKEAAELERVEGDHAIARSYDVNARRAKRGVIDGCWDRDLHLIADSPAKTVFSQHSNTLAVLYDVVPRSEQVQVMQEVLSGKGAQGGMDRKVRMIPASYYFDSFVARALVHAGIEDRYFDLVAPWRTLVRMHFSTWPETPGDTRSDSHAWSAHPTSDLLTIVAGIRPVGLGFFSVSIEPHLGGLTTLDAAMPHDGGMIQVHYAQSNGSLAAYVDLPDGLSGTFHWKGRKRTLHPGLNILQLNSNLKL